MSKLNSKADIMQSCLMPAWTSKQISPPLTQQVTALKGFDKLNNLLRDAVLVILYTLACSPLLAAFSALLASSSIYAYLSALAVLFTVWSAPLYWSLQHSSTRSDLMCSNFFFRVCLLSMAFNICSFIHFLFTAFLKPRHASWLLFVSPWMTFSPIYLQNS